MASPSSSISDDTLADYFFSGRSYKVVLKRLEIVHGTKRSLSWLKRQYRRLGLKRRCVDPTAGEIRALIQLILNSSDNLRGYRAIWRILRSKYKVSVRRDTVMNSLRVLDPEGIEQRRARRLKRRLYNCLGPNHVWHVDGYCKLTPYGLAIHGCIDGFSRKIIWLKLSNTNSDPRVIARYYLESIEHAGGCPRVVRADYGTENCVMAKYQVAFGMMNSASRSFIYGPSTANVRIEAWWAQLRKFKTEWWIDTCKSLVSEGHFSKSNLIHRYTLGLILGQLLQKDIDAFVLDWNSHPIRKNSHVASPHGHPEDIYDMPSLYGASDQIQLIDGRLWAKGMFESLAAPKLFPDHFKVDAETVLHDIFGLTINSISHSNCRNIYIRLLPHMEALYSTVSTDSVSTD